MAQAQGAGAQDGVTAPGWMLGLDVLLAKCFYIGATGFTYGASLAGFSQVDDALRGPRSGLTWQGARAGLAAAAREGAYTSRVLLVGMAAAGTTSLLLHGPHAPARLHRLPFPAADDRASTWVGAAAALYAAMPAEAMPQRALRGACAATGATALTCALLLLGPAEAPDK